MMKRGENYAVRYTVPKEFQAAVGPKDVERSLGTPDLVVALKRRDETLRETEAELKAKLEGEPSAAKAPLGRTEGTTVKATAHRWLVQADGIKNKTRQKYRQHLETFEAFAGNVEVSQIDRGLALHFMKHLKTTPSERTGEMLSARSLQSGQSCLASF